jgi:hypothetical protein
VEGLLFRLACSSPHSFQTSKIPACAPQRTQRLLAINEHGHPHCNVVVFTPRKGSRSTPDSNTRGVTVMTFATDACHEVWFAGWVARKKISQDDSRHNLTQKKCSIGNHPISKFPMQEALITDIIARFRLQRKNPYDPQAPYRSVIRANG